MPTSVGGMEELGVDAVIVSRLKYDTRHDHVWDRTGEQYFSSVYLNLFTPKDGLIWSYENGGHRGFKTYDRLVSELIFDGRNQLPYAVAK